MTIPAQANAKIQQGPAWCEVSPVSDAIGAARQELFQLCLTIQLPCFIGLHLLTLDCRLV